MGSRAPKARLSTLTGAIVSVALASCSLFVSLDGLDDGRSATTNDDAATSDVLPGIDGSSGDATSSDGSSAADSGVDACVFCDDFDYRTTPQGAWQEVSGNVDISGAEFVTSPHSAHFHSDAQSSGASFDALRVPIALDGNATSVDFDVKLVTDLSGAGGFINVMTFTVDGNYAGSASAAGGQGYFDYWVDFPDGGHIQPLVSTATGVDTDWHHVHYAIAYDSAAGRFAVSIDGTSLTDQTGLVTYGGAPDPTSYVLTIGLVTNGQLPAIDLYVDDVQVR